MDGKKKNVTFYAFLGVVMTVSALFAVKAQPRFGPSIKEGSSIAIVGAGVPAAIYIKAPLNWMVFTTVLIVIDVLALAPLLLIKGIVGYATKKRVDFRYCIAFIVLLNSVTGIFLFRFMMPQSLALNAVIVLLCAAAPLLRNRIDKK